MSSPTIAAVVCAHTLDRWDLFVRSVASLTDQTCPADEIILSIDNNEALAQRCRSWFGPQVRVVENTSSRGVSPTRNVAAESSSCDILAFLDDDATAVPGWIESLIAPYENPNVLGVGGVANPDWQHPGEPRWFPASFNWVVGCSHSGIPDSPHELRNFIGCNMSVRRSAWQAIGGFSNELGRVGSNTAGCDETDFCIRLKAELDGIILHAPTAVVDHTVPTSRQTVRYFMTRCFSEGVAKGQITNQVGSNVLGDEKRHLTRTMPQEFLGGLSHTFRGDLYGVARSSMIVLGTAATGLGFARSVLSQAITGNAPTLRPSRKRVIPQSTVDFVPSRVVVIDLDQPDHAAFEVSDVPVFAVARRGSQLLGVVPNASASSVAPLRDTPARASIEAEIGHTASRTIAVVIATRDRTESLERCLTSLAASTTDADQVIVVDNAPSGAETRHMIERWNNDGRFSVTYTQCDRRGLANAHNAALPLVTSDVVAFTDDDVLIDPLWIDQIKHGFDLSSDIVCVTGAIMPAELDTWPQQWAEDASRFNKGFEPSIFDTSTNRPADPLFPFTAGTMGSGANMAFDSEWLRANDGFRSELGAGTIALGGDDLRAFYDVVMSGHRLAFNPDAIVFHHHHRTGQAIANQSYGYGSGLTAFIASVIHDDPRALGKIATSAPRAFRRARSITQSAAATQFPEHAHRARLHRRGMFSGPIRYVRSVRRPTDAPQARRLPVLNYHGVGKSPSADLDRWTVSVENFVQQLDYLQMRGWQGVSMTEALSNPQDNQIVLTFDDGFSDFAAVVAPLLLERDFSATLYVVAGDIGGEPNWLPDATGTIVSWQQLRRIHDAGFEIGSHSVTHPQLDLLSDDEARHEIVESKRILETELEAEIAGFCYPHGFSSASVRTAVVEAGYEYACSVRHKLSMPGDDPYALARIVVFDDTTIHQLDRWIRGVGLRRGGVRLERALATVFRAYRRTRHRPLPS